MKRICLHNAILFTGYTRMENCALFIEDCVIKEIFSERRMKEKNLSDCTIIDVHGAYVMPGFIDTHIHGFCGNGIDTCSVDSILCMAKDLISYGVTSFHPTIYPQPEKIMIKSIKTCVDAISKQTALNGLGARIAGIHLEGPFLSKKRAGVQRPEFMREVDFNLMQKFLDAAQGHIINMTVAPELHNMRELALFCLRHHIVLQAGHTNASYENIVEGVQAGIMHVTHFFNAMSRLHHRDPGAVGAIMIHPEISCEIIADGHHVHPHIIKLLLRNKSIDQVVLVTDALTPTEQKADVLFANGEEVYLKDDVFYRKKDDVIAGSSLTMLKGLQNLYSYGVSLNDVVKMSSVNPARIMNVKNKGTLMPGYDADVIVLSKNFDVMLVIKEGQVCVNNIK